MRVCGSPFGIKILWRRAHSVGWLLGAGLTRQTQNGALLLSDGGIQEHCQRHEWAGLRLGSGWDQAGLSAPRMGWTVGDTEAAAAVGHLGAGGCWLRLARSYMAAGRKSRAHPKRVVYRY